MITRTDVQRVAERRLAHQFHGGSGQQAHGHQLAGDEAVTVFQDGGRFAAIKLQDIGIRRQSYSDLI